MAFALLLIAIPCVFGQSPKYPAVPAEPRSELFGSGIQRTMTLLATSTPERRHQVRILFYGQSITKQEWSRLVADDIRSRFPFADLTIENRAIGGYSSEFLIQTVAHDVYGFYPDLIIFHDYGGEKNYETIIAGIRQHTTAEILIQNDYPTWTHVDGTPDPLTSLKRETFHEQHSHRWLPDLCRRYRCEVVDVRSVWYEYLLKNRLHASDILSDGTHLNAEGNYLLAEITKRHLRYDASLPATAWADLVSVYKADDLHWNHKQLKLDFEGNRVDVVAADGLPYHSENAEVRIDGRKPSEIPELYFITRPTDTYAVDWPAVNRITHGKPLLAEEWTLRVIETNQDDSWWRFEVVGSKTGADGVGESTQPFVSRSGRVVIDPGEWGVNRAYGLNHKLTPKGFAVRWQVIPMFTDVYRAPRITDSSHEYATILALGLANGKHVLELTTEDATNPPLREIRVYRPPFKP